MIINSVNAEMTMRKIDSMYGPFDQDEIDFYIKELGDYDATMTAEIRFLRALHYYHLMDGWGNVPFTLAVSSEAPEQISRQDLYNWLETELLEIVDDLSEPKAKKSSEAGYGRADKKEVDRMVHLTLQTDKLPKLDDTVDAIAIAICHSRG